MSACVQRGVWPGQVLRPRHLHLHPGLGRAQVRGEGGVSPRQVGRLLRPALLLRPRLELQTNPREVCSYITTKEAPLCLVESAYYRFHILDTMLNGR